MKKHYAILLGGLLFASSAFAQGSYKRCASDEYLHQQMQQDPAMQARLNEIEGFTQKFVNKGGANKATTQVTIPVVFHVVYRTAAQNVSQAMLDAQLKVLNDDFAKANADYSTSNPYNAVAAATNVRFTMGSVIRKSTSKTSFSTNDGVKKAKTGGSDAVDPTRNLNIWVCNLGNGLLGYAQFPGGPVATDGVVVLYSSLPGGTAAPYNKGRTLTHEVGHYLNLRHIWGDATCGSDLVGDTPSHNTANYGCPGNAHRSTCSGTPIEMSMNYMDYTDDACMYMFSAGQSARMDALFAPGGARAAMAGSGAITTNPNTSPESGLSASASRTLNSAPASVFPNPVTGEMNVSYNVAAEGAVNIQIYNVMGALVGSYNQGTQEEGNHIFKLTPNDQKFGALKNGVYFCRINGAEAGKVIRFVVER